MSDNGQGDLFDGNGMGRDHLYRLSRKPLVKCTSCGGNVKVYRRKLNAGMGAILCWLTVNREPDEWTQLNEVPKHILKSREFGKLIYSGFLEQRSVHNDEKKSSGYWRTTDMGRRFARAEILAPSHAFINIPGGDFLGWEDTTTNIVDAVEYKNRFKYGELMRGEG